MPKARNPSRRDPQKKFRCIRCKKQKRGCHFYIKVKRMCVQYVTMTSAKSSVGAIFRILESVHLTTIKIDSNTLFNVWQIRKGLHWRLTYKWFATDRPMKFHENLIEQLKKNDVKMEDYEITWKLGFAKTDGLTLREQFKYTIFLKLTKSKNIFIVYDY